VHLEASIRLGGVLKRNAVIPDAFFGLRIGSREARYFMLEIDRGEMPVERYKNLNGTYFAKTMLTTTKPTDNSGTCTISGLAISGFSRSQQRHNGSNGWSLP
jgi:hypothetical protein